MKITPVGAALEVTGSSFLLETESERFLVDCGLFQGHESWVAQSRKLHQQVRIALPREAWLFVRRLCR